MKERPILFGGPMVSAILADRKTQTRRIAKDVLPWAERFEPAPFKGYSKPGGWIQMTADEQRQCALPCRFETGMRLWVRESWCAKADPITSKIMWNEDGETYQCHYQADGEEVFKDDGDGFIEWRKDGSPASPWKSSIFMPRWASRITLEVTDVRVERLQDISDADCWAEGIGREGRPLEALFNLLLTQPKISIGDLALRMPGHFDFGDDPKIPTDREKVTWVTPKGVYAALWESIHGPGSWSLNPWVFAVSFRRIEEVPHD